MENTTWAARPKAVAAENTRAQPYLDWHRSLAHGCYMLDVDSIEWRQVDGAMVPVGLLELTRINDGIQVVGSGYLDIIRERFEEKTMQAYATRYIARKLGVPAWIVVFQQQAGSLRFWLYCLTTPNGWDARDEDQMRLFLERLGKPVLTCPL